MSDLNERPDEVFARALREAISTRGLSLERLRAHLAQRGHHVSVATLSYWQTARSRPDRAASLAALASLEDILGVNRGSLSSLLPPRRRRSAARFMPTTDPARPNVGYGALLDAAVADLGLSWDDGLMRVSVHNIVEVDERGHSRRVVAREVVMARKEPITRFPIWVHREDSTATMRVSGRRNCEVTKVIPIERGTVAVVELTLSRPVPPGQAMAVEYEVDLSDADAPMTQHVRASRSTVRELHMEIRFSPERLPRSAEQFVIVGEKRRTTPLLLKGPVLDVRLSDFGPGVAGIEWVW